MSSGDNMFENLLYGMTIFLGIMSIINTHEFAFGFFIWLFFLGILQVLHSFVIASCYWKNEKIRKGIVVYWILAGIDLLFLFLVAIDMEVYVMEQFEQQQNHVA